jgi:hypothetical protein
MSIPKVSIIATAIHTEFWQKLYADLSRDNPIPFEIVFVGSKKPDFALPPNFIYIYSDAKPVQCLETAARNAHGEYCMITADDVEVPPRMLYDMNYFLIRMFSDKAIVSARFADSANGPPNDKLLVLDTRNPRSPVLGVNTMIKRSVWKEIGGLDKRFFAFKADLDLQMRIYASGGYLFLVPDSIAREKPRPGPRLVDTFSAHDSKILYDLWVLPNGETSKTRMGELHPFEDNEIPIVR